MNYVLLILSFLGVAGFFFWRDYRFRHKDLREVATPEQKKYLNLPSADENFSERLPRDLPAKRPSQRLLEDMNDENV